MLAHIQDRIDIAWLLIWTHEHLFLTVCGNKIYKENKEKYKN
jgi:hypothetical protein